VFFNQGKIMAYDIKVQKVDRKTTRSFYVNLPTAIAEAALVAKGEIWEWTIEDKNTFVLKRKSLLKINNRQKRD
jgi:hypothetical protein